MVKIDQGLIVDTLFKISKILANERKEAFEVSLTTKNGNLAYLYLPFKNFSKYRKLLKPNSKIRLLEVDKVKTYGNVSYYYISNLNQIMFNLDKLVRVTDVIGKDAQKQWLNFNRGIKAPRTKAVELGTTLHKFTQEIAKDTKWLIGKSKDEIQSILVNKLDKWLKNQKSLGQSIYYAIPLIDSISSILSKLKEEPEIFLCSEYPFISPDHGLIGQVDFFTKIGDKVLIEEYYFTSGRSSTYLKELQASAYCKVIADILGLPLNKVEIVIKTFKKPSKFEDKPEISKLKALEPLEPVVISGDSAWVGFKKFTSLRNSLLKIIKDVRIPKTRKTQQKCQNCLLYEECKYYRECSYPEELSKLIRGLIYALDNELQKNLGIFIETITSSDPREIEIRGLTYLGLEIKEISNDATTLILSAHKTIHRSRYLYKGAIVRVASEHSPLHGYRVGEIKKIKGKEVTVALNHEITPILRKAEKLRIDPYPLLEFGLRFKKALAFLELGQRERNEFERISKILSEYIINPAKIPKVMPIEFKHDELDESQCEAVGAALGADKYSFVLIHGPPGTGKTKVGGIIAAQEVRNGKKVLLTAHNNRPVDCLLKTLPKDIRKKSIRIGNKNRVDEILRKECVVFEPSDDSELAVNQVRNAQVVGVTTSSIASKLFESAFRDFSPFDICILDEATQCTIPSALLPLCYSKKWILLGDHRQLHPVILSKDCKSLKRTLFKIIAEFSEKERPDLLYFLHTTRRLPKLTCSIVGHYVYDKKLKTVRETKLELIKDLTVIEEVKRSYQHMLKERFGLELHLPIKAVSSFIYNKSDACMIDISRLCYEKEHLGSYQNPFTSMLSLMIAELVERLSTQKLDIRIITPYEAQIVLTKRLIQDFSILANVKVESIDAIQGSQCDITILDLVRCNIVGTVGFLETDERINVAFSRHKLKVYVIGDYHTLRTNRYLIGAIVNVLKFNGALYSIVQPKLRFMKGD